LGEKLIYGCGNHLLHSGGNKGPHRVWDWEFGDLGETTPNLGFHPYSILILGASHVCWGFGKNIGLPPPRATKRENLIFLPNLFRGFLTLTFWGGEKPAGVF